MILSVSRRSDIPAFYSDWFFRQLRQGFVLVPNPINQHKVARIELKPLRILNVQTNLLGEKVVKTQGNIEGIVFWSKNPKLIMDKLKYLDSLGIKYYFLYTLNAYPKSIEGGLPSLEERINTFKELSKLCPVIWRYDPILLSREIDINWHINEFKKLCEKLKGYTNNCKVSFVIESYKGCSKSVWAPSSTQRYDILSSFVKIAKENNIQLETCAESGDYLSLGIMPSKCIDGKIFENLLTEKFKSQNIKVTRKNNKIDGQRKHCGCMPAVDIGRYDTCRHNCNYCYARKGSLKSMEDGVFGEIYERKTELEFEYK